MLAYAAQREIALLSDLVRNNGEEVHSVQSIATDPVTPLKYR